MQRNTVNDFFCGAGGIGLGFKNEGYEIVGAWDYDKYAVESYKVNVDSKVKLMDITKMKSSDIPYADVWTFGFPCQDLSYAGKQAGMKVKCGDCGFEYDKGIENEKCPKCESTNFKTLTRSGLFFEIMRLLNEVDEKPKVILAENVKALKKYLPTLEKEYKKVGYKTFYTLYNSKYWGVPQNRERYFVVGIREDLDVDFEFPEQQTSSVPKLVSVLEKDVDEKYYLSEEKSRKIIERFNINKHNEPVSAPLRFLDRNQKEVSNYSLCLDASGTNGVAEPKIIASCGRYNEEGKVEQNYEPRKDDISNTLTSVQKDNLVLESIKTNELQSIYSDKDDCAYCCDANYSKGTSPNDIGKGRRTHVIEEIKNDVNESFDKKFRIRKLTPREYARLQGFPDSYKIVVSNTQFYKQMGNAVTVNVAQVIAKAIKEQVLCI